MESETKQAEARYRVHLGGRRYARFATLEEACAFCGRVFTARNIVLSIEAIQVDKARAGSEIYRKLVELVNVTA